MGAQDVIAPEVGFLSGFVLGMEAVGIASPDNAEVSWTHSCFKHTFRRSAKVKHV